MPMLKNHNDNGGYKVFPASNSPVEDNPAFPGRKLLCSFHKYYLDSTMRSKDDLQPISSSTVRWGCDYQGGQGTNKYLQCYTASPATAYHYSQDNPMWSRLYNDIWFGAIKINDGTFWPYMFWCLEHSMTVNMYAAYYVMLVKGTVADIQQEIENDGYTMVYFYGNMGSDYNPADHTMHTTINAVYDHSVDDLDTHKTIWYGKTCDVRILSNTKIGVQDYCVISVTKYNHNDYLVNNTGKWFTMPFVCHQNPDAYIIYSGMEAYGFHNS
jgi:hypothetical protein